MPFDTINRLSTLTHKQSSTTLAGYTYAYDGLSRPTSVNLTVEGISTYSYDATSQVTGADHNSQTDETYGYDLNGNRNTSGYTIASNNCTTAGQGFTYTYDDEGNRLIKTETSKGKVQSFEWDFRNRLVTVTGGNTLWGLGDHLGSLRDIADRNDSTGITTVTNHRTFSVICKLVSETNAAVDLLFTFAGEQLVLNQAKIASGLVLYKPMD